MIKNLQEIRHALAVKLGIARSNEQRDQDEGGLKEREALEALQSVEMDWQKAKESVRESSERILAATLQEQHRERSAKREAEQKIGVTFAKHVRPLDLGELRDKPREMTGLFSKKNRKRSRENEVNFLDPDHKALSKEEFDQSRELEKAIRHQKAREARRRAEERNRRDRDRGYDLSR